MEGKTRPLARERNFVFVMCVFQPQGNVGRGGKIKDIRFNESLTDTVMNLRQLKRLDSVIASA